MLTLFSMPKPFRGHIGVIQRNAVASWVKLGPTCEVILFGDEQGTAETATEFGVRYIPEVLRNEHGTPLLNDVFDKAEQRGTYDLLCYVNGDIILGADFIRAVEDARAWSDRFLMVGECWDVRIDDSLPLATEVWENRLAKITDQTGRSRGPWYIDYFVFTRGLYKAIPTFAVGRAGFDNWLVWKARSAGAAVIDATRVVKAVHQNHDYSHVPGGRDWSYLGPEAKTNKELAGGRRHLYMILDASHCLGNNGIRCNLGSLFRIKSRWQIGKAWFVTIARRVGWRIVEWTRPVRHSLGLRKTTLSHLKVLWSSRKSGR